MKGLKLNIFLIILSFCSFFKAKAPGGDSDFARAQFEKYGRQVALLRQKVAQTRQFYDSILAVKQILKDKLLEIAKIDEQISEEQSLEEIERLNAFKEALSEKVKPAIAEYSRLKAEMERLVSDCLNLNELVVKLEKTLVDSVYRAVQKPADDLDSQESGLAEGSQVSDQLPMILPENTQKNVGLVVAQPDFETEISLIKKAFRRKMQAIDLEMRQFIKQIRNAGIRASQKLVPGSKKDPILSDAYSSSSFEQQAIVADGDGQEKRVVSKRMVLDDNGKKTKTVVFGTAEKENPDGGWKFEVEETISEPGQKPIITRRAGTPQELEEFNRQFSKVNFDSIASPFFESGAMRLPSVKGGKLKITETTTVPGKKPKIKRRTGTPQELEDFEKKMKEEFQPLIK